MISDFSAATSRKMIVGALLLIILPIIFVVFMNMQGEEGHRIDDLIFMRGGSIGIPVVLGYGISFGLLLSKLRQAVMGSKSSAPNDES
jgi:hypothetical protein